MSKGSTNKCPSTDELSMCLDSVVLMSSELSTHIECCVTCRRTLEFMAGQPEWWSDAELLLAEPPSATEARIAQRVCAMSEANAGRNGGELTEHELQQLKQLLAAPSHPELLGRISRYELEQLVGRGGMGLVFRAHDTELHRVVAVKTLALHLVPIASARERFVREARAVASLSHPHIVPMYDVITDGPVPALVMQFVAGTTLQQRIADRGPLPIEDVLQIGIQLGDALVAAHSHGLVHRDIKPGNVLLEADGSRALLSDFGLVRALDDASLTHSGLLAGTPDYMSPEQARGHAVDARSDLFSLGSVLYSMLVGHPPFRAPDPMAVLNRICHERHRSASVADPRVPIELSQLIDRLLAKNPKHRLKDATEVRDQLLELAKSPRRLATPTKLKLTSRTTLVSLAIVGCLALLVNVYIASRNAAFKATQNVFNYSSAPSSNMGEMMSGDMMAGEASAEPSLADFTELRAIDALLKEVAAGSAAAMTTKMETELDHSIDSTSSIDSELGQLDAELKQLETVFSD